MTLEVDTVSLNEQIMKYYGYVTRDVHYLIHHSIAEY
jgi:hypothetical protein